MLLRLRENKINRLPQLLIATLSAVVISAFAMQGSYAQGNLTPTAPPQFKGDYVFLGTPGCLNSASAACRRKPRPRLAAGFQIDTPILEAGGSLHLQGNTAAVRLDVRQARISEVLSALGTAFNMQYRSSITLDEIVNGTYAGSLRHVILRLLDGYNYVLKQNDASLDLVIVSERGERAIAAPIPAAMPIRRGLCTCPVIWPPPFATRLSRQNRCVCDPQKQ
jgi:hypothetical protein